MLHRVAVGRRLGSWLASAATAPISSSRSSSVADKTAPWFWARMRKTSRSQSGSSRCRSRSAAAISLAMTMSLAGSATVSPRRRRSNGESSQLLITPVSSQTLHCHRIGAPDSVRSTIIRPGQARLAGRRRHGSALSHAVPGSPEVAARTMLPRCSASRRAGPGVSGGKSSKWCRSVTITRRTVSSRSVPAGRLVQTARRARAWASQ